MMQMKKESRKSKEALIQKAATDKKAYHYLDEKLRKENMWPHYIFQSLLATFVMFLVLLLLINAPVIVAALGASAFIVFAMPKNVTAQPRNLVGGHVVGAISGSVFASLLIILNMDSVFHQVIAASASVGLTIFIMVVTDTEHPPGCSTSLGLVIYGSTPSHLFSYAGFILISAVILSGVKHVLSPQLKDLV